jgi:hypothetical protein
MSRHVSVLQCTELMVVVVQVKARVSDIAFDLKLSIHLPEAGCHPETSVLALRASVKSVGRPA